MKLNHLNLSVQDVPACRSLFETYFDFIASDSKLNDKLAILTGPDGFILVLMNEHLNRNGNNSYPDAFHIGFYLDDESSVIERYQRLLGAGLTLPEPPKKIRKTFGFYFNYDRFMIEIAC